MKTSTYGQRRTVPHRRKREGKTDYRKRLRLLESRLPRLIIRKTLHHIMAQLVTYAQKGDQVIAAAHSGELKKYGYTQSTSNLPAAYLVGNLLAKKAKEKKVNTAVLDLGLQTRHNGGKLFAVLKGAVDGGLHVAHDETVMPSPERIMGNHLPAEKKIKVQAEFNKAKGALQ